MKNGVILRLQKFTRLFFAVAILVVPSKAQIPNTSWYNTTATNFTISTADQLAGLARIVNGTWGGTPTRDSFSGKTITLAANIDLSGYATGQGWVPIGPTLSMPFSGTFNSSGYVVSNLTIPSPSPSQGVFSRSDAGLFGAIVGGKVENLGLINVNIVGSISAGAVAGTINNSMRWSPFFDSFRSVFKVSSRYI